MTDQVFSRRVRACGAAVLSTLLILLALPATAATAAETVGTKVTTGTITWGVKSSFRGYVGSQGSIETSAPATDGGSGYVFPAATGTWTESAADVVAKGAVRFRAHEDVLNLSVSAPRIVVAGGTAQLKVDAVDSDGTSHPGLVVADLDLAGRVSVDGTTVTVDSAPATLTADGEKLFSYGGSSMYQAGEALDPVSARLTLETITAPVDPEPTDPGETTGPTDPTDPGGPGDPSEPTDPGQTTPPPAVPDNAITGGTLSWGFKESFRKYLEMPFVEGDSETIEPATDDGRVVTFRQASGVWDSTQVDVRTRGGVRFTGHHGVMNFTVQNLRLVVDAKRSHLRADVEDSQGNVFDGLVFATVDLGGAVRTKGDTVTITGAPVTLTKAGEAMFDYTGSPMYTAGTALDPLNGTLTVKTASAPPKAPVTKPGKAPSKSTPKAQKPRPVTKDGVRVGDLTWGVKASFRSYVTGPISKGSVSVSGGAASTGGAYRFGQTSTTATPPSATGTTTYGGAVSFRGHEGTLSFSISQPSVRVTSPVSGVLSANVTGRGRVDIATLNLTTATRSTEAGWVRYAGAQARLTAAGTSIFSYQGRGFYGVGELLDPVSFSIGAAGSVGGGTRVVASTTTDEWTAPPTPPATTGLTVEQDELRAGGEVTASGSGFLANESGIRVVLYSTPLVLADDVTADASGRATWTGTLPATIEPGRHTLTFQGSVDRGVVIDVAEAEKIVGCELTDGRLQWGFKESFRAYISGGIANGDWTTGGDAGYETPEFFWTKGSGVLAEDTHRGRLEFDGSIQFTGHDGALDTRITDPVVTFVDEKSAVLSVDYTGGTMDAALAGKDDSKTLADVPFADLDLAAGTRTRQGDRVTITGIPATLTSAGSAAFPNYETGAALDPITLVYTASTDCDAAAPVKTAVEDTSAVVLDPLAPTEARDWVTFAAVGGLLALLTLLGATVLVMRRRTPGAGA